MPDRLIIFDTTLRDGEQSPGASMTREEKMRIAKQLERLKVDVIEAGFPASSNGDFESVKAIAHGVTVATVVAVGAGVPVCVGNRQVCTKLNFKPCTSAPVRHEYWV